MLTRSHGMAVLLQNLSEPEMRDCTLLGKVLISHQQRKWVDMVHSNRHGCTSSMYMADGWGTAIREISIASAGIHIVYRNGIYFVS